MAIEIEVRRYRDEAKILSEDIRALVHAYVERETGRAVHSVELHSDGRAGIGAATIRFKFPDEQ